MNNDVYSGAQLTSLANTGAAEHLDMSERNAVLGLVRAAKALRRNDLRGRRRRTPKTTELGHSEYTMLNQAIRANKRAKAGGRKHYKPEAIVRSVLGRDAKGYGGKNE